MIERDLNDPRPVKDEEGQHPVPGAWRGTLREIVRAFVAGDFGLTKGVARVEAVEPEKADDIRASVAAYGATLVDLPEGTWNTSVAQWYGTHWQVLVDLWTAEEGRSDLVLDCHVQELDNDFCITLHFVYVP